MRFTWDENKNQANIKNRNIDFNDASEVFFDDNAISFEDKSQTYDDRQRMRIIGECTSLENVLFVVYTEIQDDNIRIVSARLAEKQEISIYRQR